MGSRQLLDRVQSLALVAALEEAPHGYADQLALELADGAGRDATGRDALAVRDAALRDALAHLDELAARVMRIRLERALSDDTAIATPTRKVFAATVTSYAGRLDVLEVRAHEVASRGGSLDPARVARAVVDAARATLALHAVLRASVLAVVARLATASAAGAEQRACDRGIDDPTRRAWSALRRELEAVAADPERVEGAALAARLAAWPEQLDEPEAAREPTFADLIELE